jgi:pteridine reductase
MLTPRVALVTGGSKRVGRAIVLRLADAGFNIAFTYLTSKLDAQNLIAELSDKGRKAIAIQADLSKPTDAATQITQSVIEAFPRLDVLVNNASIYEPGDLSKVDPAQVRRHYAVHLESPLLLCQNLARSLRDSKGHVINMVDLLAEKPRRDYLAYCSSKAALLNLTLSLAKELAPEVTVNGIAPGVVDWPDTIPESEKQTYLKRVPLARPGTPTDVAELVHYLVTTGSYITGQILHLDGGRSIT